MATSRSANLLTRSMRLLVLILITLLVMPTASLASWLDSDYWCRVYGCVVASDGRAYDIYDVYNFNTGRTVPVGSPLIAWSNNPHQGSGVVDSVVTGGLNPVAIPDAGESLLLGIDSDGDQQANISVNDTNSNGFLDLGDSLSEFSLSPVSDVVLKNGVVAHSFYVASRTDFYVYGRASLQSHSGQLASEILPEDTGLEVSMVRSGIDSGYSFGSRTANPGFSAASGITSLQDIWGVATRVAEFSRSGGTRSRNSNDVSTQSVRLDFQYDLPEPDFSYGTGSLNYRVEYLFYNR